MKTAILGLLAAGVMASATAPAQAQISIPIPGTNLDVRIGDPDYGDRPYYNDGYYQNYRYYNRYNDNRGFWMDANGYARWNNNYYTGWRGNVYYRNGQPYQYRDNWGREHYYRVIW